MSQSTNVVRGTIRADGTLELAEPLTLPAGAVEVTVRPIVEASNWPAQRDPAKETLWQYMQRTRAELEATGHQFRTKEEIDAEIEDMRDWDGKIEETYRRAEKEQRQVELK